jgi:hypothetical protein
VTGNVGHSVLWLLTWIVVCAAADQSQPPKDAIWNAARTAAAASSPGPGGSRVFVFFRQPDGPFLKVDLSHVEDVNFGLLGRKRSEYERFETKPIEWSLHPSGLLQLEVRTRAWKAGTRYAATEPLLIQTDGQVLWR